MPRKAPRLLPVLVLACVAAPVTAAAQDVPREVLSFSVMDSAGRPSGWGMHPAETVSLDSAVARSAPYAVRLARPGNRPEQASTLTYRIPVAVAGSRLELRGWLRTAEVEGFAGLWLRQDAPGGSVQFDNMQSRRLAGTTEWTEYRISLPLDRRARSIYFGALLVGSGTAWVDDLELLVDGRPLAEAPRVQAEPDGLELDREFADASRIATTPLSALQVANLALLARVWGFTKYHHPRVTGGGAHWDFELFRVLPDVLAAGDRAQATSVISTWLARLGEPSPCSTCAQPPANAQLQPPIDWIRDTSALGDALSRQLLRMHRDRPAAGEQYYVSHMPGVGNPDFMNEALYPTLRSPDAGYRLLALFRLWNIIEYWFPYRDLLEEDWNEVLAEYIPRLMAADGADAYRLELMQLIGRVYDTHANLWGELHLRPPVGNAQLPVTVRFLDGRAVVTGYAHAEQGPASGLLPGDIIEALDGARIDSLVRAWQPYYAASNEPTRLRDIAGSLTRGAAGVVQVRVRRAGDVLEFAAARLPEAQLDLTRQRVHDLPGETFQRLTEDVAYLKLSSVELPKVPEYVQAAAGAKVLVIDIRNYPSAFMVFALGGRLVAEPTEFARFTVGDAANPGAFTWTEPLKLQPLTPRFVGKVVVLVDEVSQSQAEYTAMAFRAAGATIVGSTTAGADGNISPIPLPGGTRGMISGIGVFYPDRTPTQRIGIIPDVEVRPTVEGIRAGRDEVLEAAVSHALGREFRLPRR